MSSGSGTASSSAKSQVNARIDANLKARGDAALARAGYTPTQAVRAVWTFAACHEDDPDAVSAMLDPEGEEAEQAALAEARGRKLELLRAGSAIVRDAYRAAGMRPGTEGAESSYDELEALAYEEEVGQMMGWS